MHYIYIYYTVYYIYLYSSNAQVSSHQHPPINQSGNACVLHFQEVQDHLGDVRRPISTQHVHKLPTRVSWFGYEVCEDSHQSILILEGTAPALPLIILIVLTVTRRPGTKENQLVHEKYNKI